MSPHHVSIHSNNPPFSFIILPNIFALDPMKLPTSTPTFGSCPNTLLIASVVFLPICDGYPTTLPNSTSLYPSYTFLVLNNVSYTSSNVGTFLLYPFSSIVLLSCPSASVLAENHLLYVSSFILL